MENDMISKKQIGLIHVAKQRTGMSEDEYRGLLSSFGVASSTDLSGKDFEAAMRHFAKLGFRPLKPFRKAASGKQRLMAKVSAIRSELSLPEAYVDAMAARMFKVDSYRWLSADQLHKLVAALTYHQRKQAAR
jgi:phage gp16-like protein